MRSTLFAAALLLPVVALATEHVSTIPDRFVGSWAGSPASCGSDADDLVLRLDHHHISCWESEGQVRSVVVRGGNEVALISELSGEGETWLATAKFELSSDGAILTDSTTIPGQDTCGTDVRQGLPRGLTINQAEPASPIALEVIVFGQTSPACLCRAVPACRGGRRIPLLPRRRF